MFYFIFAANDLSDSYFREKFIMSMLIGREHNKKDTKSNRYIQNKRDIKLPMFKMKLMKHIGK